MKFFKTAITFLILLQTTTLANEKLDRNLEKAFGIEKKYLTHKNNLKGGIIPPFFI